MSTAPSGVRLSWGSTVVVLTEDVVVLGRDLSCDVVLGAEDVSRRHAELRRTGDDWCVVDLASTNGTWLEGRRVDRERLDAGRASRLLVGGPAGVAVLVEPLAVREPRPVPEAPGPAAPVIPPGRLADGAAVLPVRRPAGRVLTIGRTRSNDVVLDDPLVSRQHATLEPGAPAVLRDLESFNGTFVNGHRIDGAVPLAVGDEVIVGHQAFGWDGSQLVARTTRHDLTLHAEHLTTTVARGKRLLDDVSFELAPSTLTAVIGPSGAGKSTLLGALTGLRPATRGRVVWQGHDLYTHYEQLRFQIGRVPQQDIQHPQLTVRQGLTYAARLRLPPDTSADECAARVDRVVAQLQLEDQIDLRIGTQLSGGQRKRVSIATELLTAPPLLFLDEPTSGLDPGLDRDVMRQLRHLADEGRVVVVVTHSVLALDGCDRVMVMAPGGRLAHVGPPGGVLAHFGAADYPAVFDLLDAPDPVDRSTPPTPARTGEVDRLPALNGPVPPPPRQSFGRQLSTLVRRNLAVTAADRLLLGLLVLMPLVLGGLSRVVQGGHGLSILGTGGEGPPLAGEVVQRLTILVVAAALMGTAVTVRELVKERAIFQREYAVGLSPGAYLLAKVLVLGTAAFLQGVLVTWLATVGLPGPDDGGVLGLGTLEVALAIGAVSATMAVAGLAVSAVVTSSEQTMPALVGLVMLQLVLSGALVEVSGRPFLEQLAWLAPGRWGYALCAATVDLERPERGRPGQVVDGLFAHTSGQWWADLLVLVVLAATTLGGALLLVRRSARG
ncbi:FHA domain-containing protein [Nocardioides sp. KIGAM211]|uniref:FHA domain-containing protein n=1 Tax=Nocardioides luti TaxID=2761101 RepID=A0A7X0RK62_9ACTN|nr:FHA domain-containing protein [Nocardioides luti]MBB6628745.1 FHA domain-containing protein [Nocardioides luti]